VSGGAGDKEYADGSVRDMASFGFLFSRLASDRDRSNNGRLRPRPARKPAAAREITTMATPYPGNVTVQPAQDSAAAPIIRTIGLSDLREALRLGWEDFKAVPSHAIILCVIYPVLGLVLRSPSFGAMLGLGTLLFALFVTWVATAQAIYVAAFGYQAAADIPDFARRVLTTPEGWWLIIVGCGVGFLFALVALCVSVVSFPLMLDRHAGAGDAMVTSLRAVAQNPVPMAAWGLIVAVLLVLGSLPLFLGLTVIIPLLGHATWHLYRKVIAPDPNPRPMTPRPPRERRSAADFPANLFPWQRKDRA
jgi:uncharacterized membrane protein